jgi:glutaredoxin-like protein NrdH
VGSVITVYSKPGCPQCTATCRALDNADALYEVLDLTADAGARDYVLGLGHLQAPVVVAGRQHWSGYRPDRIRAAVDQQAASAAGGPA